MRASKQLLCSRELPREKINDVPSLAACRMKKLTVNASVVHEWTLKGSNMLSEMSEAFGVAELTDSTGQVDDE